MNGKQGRITSVDVAREAGVSQATVSYVLNNDPRQTIPEDTRAKVLEAARKLDYQPYAPARSLRMGKSKIVLVVYPESVVETGLSRVMEDLTVATADLGYSLVWQMGFSPESQNLVANLAPAVVVALVDANDTAAITSLQRFKAPIVTLAGRSWFSSGPKLQVEQLLKNGSRPIVFAGSEKPQLRTMSQSRLNIVRQACAEHGLPEPSIVTIPQRREKAREVMADLLEVKPTPFALCAILPFPHQSSIISHDNSPLGIQRSRADNDWHNLTGSL